MTVTLILNKAEAISTQFPITFKKRIKVFTYESYILQSAWEDTEFCASCFCDKITTWITSSHLEKKNKNLF